MSTTPLRSQRTIRREARVLGVGLLSGTEVAVGFRPAPADHGVVFRRVDLPDAPTVPAHVDWVVPRQRRTAIQRGAAVVEMVEHVLAALAGLRVDNCLVEIDASETPGCDGSSRAFAAALRDAGTLAQDRPRPRLVVSEAIAVHEAGATIAAYPAPGNDLVLSYHLDYGPKSPIGRQSLSLAATPESFDDELAASRTFLLLEEAEALRAAGIGRGVAETDLLIFGPDGPINNPLRFPDECVRHKMLDMVGDLALVGRDLVGHVAAHRSGHSLNAALVRELVRMADLADPPTTAAPHGGPAVLDVQGIMKVLPHRYPLLLVDRVIHLEPRRRIVALKNVTCNEPFFVGHWPGRPIMPGVLVLEALAQAAGVLIAQDLDVDRSMALIAAIDDSKFRRPVTPGDQLVLDVELVRQRSRAAEVRGTARVGDRVVAEATIRFMLVDHS